MLRHVKKMVPAYSLPGAIRLSDALADGRKRTLERVPLGHDDIAFLQYTGGTTGVAKGAMLLHRNIVANMLQARAWIRPFLDADRREVIITPLPLYHIFSLTANCLVFMTLGGENVLIPNPRDIPGFVKEMAQVQVHRVHRRQHAVQRAAQQPGIRASSISRRCKITLGGGMAVQEAVANKLEAGHRRAADRGVRPDRDLARGDDQSARPARVQRLDRPADPVDRDRCCATTRARTCRSASRARSASAARR